MKKKKPTAADAKALLAALDRLPVAFALFDAGRRLAAWNAPLAALGLFPKPLLREGNPLAEFMRRDAGLRRRAAGPHEIRLPDGRVLQAVRKRVPPGQLLVTYEDVTEARLAAQRYDTALRAVNEGVYDWDIARGTIYYSEGVHRATGMTPRDIRTPRDWRDRFHPDDLPRYDAALIAHFKGRTERFECDYRFRGRDGAWRWARQHGIAIRDARGRALRMVGSTGDITALKRVEQALAESQERYALATQAATEGIYEWNLETGSLYLSGRARDFFAVKGDALTPATWNKRVHSEDFEGYRKAVREYFDGRRPAFEHEYRILNAGGGWSWVSDRAVAVRNGAGRVLRLVGALADITQRKRREEDLRRARDEATEALERQTATAEILKVIASSPADVQPVFDAIARNAFRLCGGMGAAVFRFQGGLMHFVAHHGFEPKAFKLLQSQYPVAPRGLMGQAMRERAVVHSPDMLTDPRTVNLDLAKALDSRGFVAVPMLREGEPIGAIVVFRRQVTPFSDAHIAVMTTFADQAVIAIENVRLFNETKEALEQQKASADVLGAISGSITEIKPVFDKILESCERLFEGNVVGVTLATADGQIDLAAYHGRDYEKLKSIYPLPLSRESGSGAAILDATVAHYPDIEADGVPAGVTAGCRSIGVRAIIFAPMLFEGRGVGAIWVGRAVPGKFTEKQIALLKTFADQAVIAIQNARLFNETKEALERQTATAEILNVIASSPADVQPVFDAIAASARRLLDANAALVARRVGDKLELAAFTSTGEAADAALRKLFPAPITGQGHLGKAILTGAPVGISDILNDPNYSEAFRASVRARGLRSLVSVPMMREGEAIGVISVNRTVPGKFSEHQTNLLKTFADQAVIAIENVRLFNETKEALERQTATSEILRVISSSPTDLQPVFDAILDKATGLCDANLGALGRYDGERYEHLAHRGASPEFQAYLFGGPRVMGESTGIGRMISTRRPVHIPDIKDEPAYRNGDPARVATADIAGARTFLAVPMLKEGRVVGGIIIYRREVRPFGEKQIELVTTFASQAVIAIQNVLLFNETKEALERQTATAEILKVIASSPANVQPVFDSIVNSCIELFGGMNVALFLARDGQVDRVAFRLAPDAVDEAKDLFPLPLDGGTVNGRVILSGQPANHADVLNDPIIGHRTRVTAERMGFRSLLAVPLLRKGKAIGSIAVFRRKAERFSPQQLELLQTFADQAVIAIENVRLFNETREALERQTATAEILKVISSSPTDVQPVFEAIVRSGVRLFTDAAVAVARPEGGEVRLMAIAETDPNRASKWAQAFPFPLNREFMHGAAILDCAMVEMEDALREDAGFAPGRKNFAQTGYRAMTVAPMERDGACIGTISVVRAAPGPLPEKQKALLRTFADQAVIAIENVRLFKELQSRTEALTKSVGQLTALGEVGQAISSTLDLETVLQTIVSRAVQLTGLDGGSVYEYDERSEEFRLQAADNQDPELLEAIRRTPIRKGDGTVGGTAVTLEATQVPDILDAGYQSTRKELLVRAGYRAILTVPLLREDRVIGALSVTRKTPGAFAPEVVELLKTFATQSAMAIQNARLFREIAEKGRQLEVASQHKSNFLASMSHELRTPLNAILGFNEMILGQVYGEVPADMQAPLTDIQTSGKHLLRLINNVLDLAKIEAGRMELSLQDYSVHDTVASVHATLRPLAAEKGLEFLASVPNDVPLAYGDGGRMAQCLMNLAGNSLKFTRAGKVELAVETKGELLVYKVTDTGIGIAPDKIGSLFTEFKQTDATIASEYGGTGLGLSISRKFVEMHGGRIWVESELGRGSAFIIEVPLRVKTT